MLARMTQSIYRRLLAPRVGAWFFPLDICLPLEINCHECAT
jgi:hypothetical protein